MISDFKEIRAYGRTHIVRPRYRDGFYNYTVDDPKSFRKWKFVRERIPQPNYENTGMALCGVLKDGDTLADWYRKHGKRIEDHG